MYKYIHLWSPNIDHVCFVNLMVLVLMEIFSVNSMHHYAMVATSTAEKPNKTETNIGPKPEPE